jgi:hypothetical protein
MAQHHKHQHYVAQSYLLPWCDPNTPKGHKPYVWAFPAEGGQPKKKPPVKLFNEPDMYTRLSTAPDGTKRRDVGIEQGLSKLESNFVSVRRNRIDKVLPLTTEERAALLPFVAAQSFRTPQARENTRSQWAPVLKKMEQLKASMERATPEEKRRASGIRSLGSDGPKMGIEDVRKIVDFPLQQSLWPQIKVTSPLLADYDMALLLTEANPGFITSDHPCVWYDPAAHQRPPPYQGIAMMYDTLEISMPLSPTCLLLLNKNGLDGYFTIDQAHVDELNRRTRAFANEHFVSRSSTANPFWYDRGKAPQKDKMGPSILYER